MKGINHLIVGATTGVVISDKFNTNPIITIGLAALGSIIVDIDAEHSLINKVFFRSITDKLNRLLRFKRNTKLSVNQIKLVIGLAMLFISNLMVKYLGVLILLSLFSAKVRYKFSLLRGLEKYKYHRTIFHDPIIGTILFTVPLYLLNIPNQYKYPFLIGIILGHYLMDMFTEYGLPIYLLGIKHFRIPIIHFNSSNWIAEMLVTICYIGIVLLVKYPNIIVI